MVEDISSRPTPLPVNFDGIPVELRYPNQWILWRYKWKEGNNGKPGKWDKPPYQPNGKLASSTASFTWSSFETVKKAYEHGLNLPVDNPLHFDGIGFAPRKIEPTENHLNFGDLDKCRDKTTGEITAEAKEDLEAINSYCEPSPSGSGVRFIAKGNPPFPSGQEGRKNDSIELYQGGHYLTITGHRLPEFPATIERRPNELNAFYEKYFGDLEPDQKEETPLYNSLSDDQIICLASEARSSKKFVALMAGNIEGYPSGAEADEALAFILAYYTRDKAQILRIIQRSKLWDEKWERQDYQDRTIGKALSLVTEGYELPDVITEEEFRALPIAENPKLEVRLEPDNTIVRYIEYGKSTCDAYPEYHYAMALVLLSISTNRNLILRLKQADVFPNIWAFALGKSTISRKSAATAKGEQFAKDLFPLAALPQSYSPEGLIEELSEKPRSYLIKDEAAAMIEAMQKNYMLEMRDLYCTLYDCKGTRRKLRSGQRKEKREFEVVDPFINLFCATTPENFREYTTLLDVTSGWLIRFLYFYPTYRKPWMAFQPAGNEDFSFYAEILGRLSNLKGLLYHRESPLAIQLSPDAWEYYQAWQKARETELQDSLDSIELALWGRLSFYALKLAMLFTVARSDYKEGTSISLEHIEEACRQVDEYFLPIGKLVAEEVAREEKNNLQNKILGVLGRHGGRVQWRPLLQNLHVKVKDVEEAIEALVASEEVEDKTVVQDGKKPSRWIRKIVRKDSKVSKVSNVRSNSEGRHGISANKANLANNSNIANDDTHCVRMEDDGGATIGHASKGASPSAKEPLLCAVCGTDLTGHSHVQKGDKYYCARPGCGYPARGAEEVQEGACTVLGENQEASA